MNHIININEKIITIYYNEKYVSRSIPVIILNTFNENSEEIWNSLKGEFIFVTISNINWNSEMSPWYMKKMYSSENEDYLGKADEYINELTTSIISKISDFIKKTLNLNIEEYIISGYSLAGLFAIYCLYKTDIFKSAISCSGSFWYPDFMKYAKENNLKIKPRKIYFSLGNKEKHTKNTMMAEVEDKTIELENYYNNLGINTIYEENEGNHFFDVTNRIVKAIKWIIK